MKFEEVALNLGKAIAKCLPEGSKVDVHIIGKRNIKHHKGFRRVFYVWSGLRYGLELEEKLFKLTNYENWDKFIEENSIKLKNAFLAKKKELDKKKPFSIEDALKSKLPLDSVLQKVQEELINDKQN